MNSSSVEASANQTVAVAIWAIVLASVLSWPSLSIAASECDNFLFRLTHGQNCELLSKLRQSNYFTIRQDAVTDDVLLSYIGKNIQSVKAIVSQVDYGRDLDLFIRGTTNRLPAENGFMQTLKTASGFTGWLSRIGQALTLFDSSLATTVLSQWLQVTSTIVNGLRIYQALVGVYSNTANSRAALTIYCQSRCGSQPSCTGGLAKDVVWQMMIQDYLPVLQTMSSRIGRDIDTLKNWFENAFVTYRLVGYVDSAQIRSNIGMAIARLAKEQLGEAGRMPAPLTPKEQIVFLRNGNLWVMDGDGRNQKQLTKETPETDEGVILNTFGHFDVARDGAIVFDKLLKYRGEANIYYLALKDGSIKQLTHSNNVYSPKFSPDGTKLAVAKTKQLVAGFVHNSQGDGVWLIDLKDGNETKIVGTLPVDLNPAQYHSWYDADIAWSPDSQTLAFTRLFQPNDQSITYTVSLSDRRVSILRGADQPYMSRHLDDWMSENILLSTYDGNLYVYNFRTKKLTLRIKGCCGTFSGDGRRMIYLQTQAGQADVVSSWKTLDIWLTDLDSRSNVRLIKGALSESHGNPRWSNFGDKVAFSKLLRGRSQVEEQIWVMNADGSNSKKIADNASSPVWTIVP